jgi:hypothetical protein
MEEDHGTRDECMEGIDPSDLESVVIRVKDPINGRWDNKTLGDATFDQVAGWMTDTIFHKDHNHSEEDKKLIIASVYEKHNGTLVRLRKPLKEEE